MRPMCGLLFVGLVTGTGLGLVTIPSTPLYGAVPQCVYCTLKSNTFPSAGGGSCVFPTCIGCMAEQLSCSLSGPNCTVSGTLSWQPETSNCLDPATTTDGSILGFEDNLAYGGGQSGGAQLSTFDANVLQSSLSASYTSGTFTSLRCPNQHDVAIEMRVRHFVVLGTSPCSCCPVGTCQKGTMVGRKTYTCK